MFYSFCLSLVSRGETGLLQQKTRDWLAIAGFCEILLFPLESASHDASGTLPHGGFSMQTRDRLTNYKRIGHN
jgi:hypothetical protein